MSQMATEQPQSNNPLTRKFAGIPGWVILAGVAVIAYLYFKHQSGGGLFGSSGGTNAPLKTTGGGGSAKTGKIIVKPGAVQIRVSQTPDQDQPTPTPPDRDHTHSGGDGGPDIDFHEITVAQARELRKDLKSPRIWLGKPGGEKVQIPASSSFEKEAKSGKLYTTQYNYQKYLSGK